MGAMGIVCVYLIGFTRTEDCLLIVEISVAGAIVYHSYIVEGPKDQPQ